MSNSDVQALAVRLGRVEAQHRRFKYGVALTALLLALWSCAQMAQARRVSAEEFLLVDRAGRVRAVLGISSQGPVLGFRDESGKGRAAFGIGSGDGPGMVLADETGKPRAELVVRNGQPTLALSDGAGTVRAELVLRPEGPLFGMNGGSVQIVNGDGRLTFRAPEK